MPLTRDRPVVGREGPREVPVAVKHGGPERRPEGERGTHSWAERPFISCQLDPETGLGGCRAGAAPGTGPGMAAVATDGAVAPGLPGITHCQHMFSGRLSSGDHNVHSI